MDEPVVIMDEKVVLPGQMQFHWGAEPDSGNEMSDRSQSEKEDLSKTSMKKKASKSSSKSKKTAQPAVAASEKKKAQPKRKSDGKKQKLKSTVRNATVARKTSPETSKSVAKETGEPVAGAVATVHEAVTSTSPGSSQENVSQKDSESTNAIAQRRNYHEAMETIDLKWGAKLPKVGFGFWKVEKDKAAEVCRTAIEVGYRHLDCACDYGNETEVGQGIAQAVSDGVCDREDLWVTSKLWNTYHAPEHVQAACEKSLEDLGLDYLDLYLIHFPIAQRFVPFETSYPPGWFFDSDAQNPCIEEARVPISDTWRAMEDLAKSGLVRNIGICNFGTSQIRDLLSYATIRPNVLQVETHPYLTQEKLLRFCDQERIAYTAFSPLGAQSYFSLGMADPSEAVMEHPIVKDIAAAIGRTPAQVLLRWGVQRNTAVIPKTASRDRMEENINVFDFELTNSQMGAISSLDQQRRFNDPGDFGESAFNTFLPIYE
ncbi:MAG: aldo/keto reductase [Fuerstiella sp.]|nr:aldo/keto reductase [Fuerstiella sp.]